MSVNFPTTLDVLVNPTATDYLNSPSHAGQHANANDILELLEGKVGINSSAVTTSHDYKLSGVTSPSKALSDANLDTDGTLSANSDTKIASQKAVKTYLAAVLSALNPIGTIREFNVATNPATLLGFGTWAEYGKGKVTVAINATDTEFDVLEETGGAKTVALSKDEIPSYTLSVPAYASSIAGSNSQLMRASTGTGSSNPLSIASGGSGEAHNNLQPYIVVYRWVRTA